CVYPARRCNQGERHVSVVFFFQAEDGIRDFHVTGVQTCALPIWFFYRQDRYDKEPVYLVIITFVAGMLAVFPAMILELPFKEHLTQPTHLLVRFLVALLVVGLGEEGLKLLAVVVTAFRHRAFNEPVDGIIYAVS